jgi:hypothetical protein
MRFGNVPILPTRDFVVVIDPHALDEVLAVRPHGGVLRLVRDLKHLSTPINIHLVFPSYLAVHRHQEGQAEDVGLSIFPNESDVASLLLSREMRRRDRERIERGAEGDCRGLRLLALAHSLHADGLVTSLPTLVDARYALSRFHAVRVLTPSELPDFVEICARGHDVFCAAGFATTWVAPDAFYQFTNPNAQRFAAWFSRIVPALTDHVLAEHLRSALFNRYTFILYARDLILFYELQKQHHLRRQGQPAVFRAMVNYHLTTLYLHVWGMLDALARIANRHLALGVHPHQCYIVREEFLEALESKQPTLVHFIKSHAHWVQVIGDVRHPAAHSALVLQRAVARPTADSQKSDAEIAEIIRAEEHEFLALIPRDMVSAIEGTLISNWRHNHMKVENDDAVYVEKPDGRAYFRGPVVSVDHDLEMVTKFVNAFLDACFTSGGMGPQPMP